MSVIFAYVFIFTRRGTVKKFCRGWIGWINAIRTKFFFAENVADH